MATFPALEPGGPAYLLQLWSNNTGGIPIMVGTPESPDISGPVVEALLWQFAEGLAAHLGVSITAITRYATDSAELTPPEVP